MISRSIGKPVSRPVYIHLETHFDYSVQMAYKSALKAQKGQQVEFHTLFKLFDCARKNEDIFHGISNPYNLVLCALTNCELRAAFTRFNMY